MKGLLVLFACLFFCCVEGWSTFHKGDKQYQNFYENSARPLKECKDKISPAFCKSYKNLCFNVSKITKLCKKTCGDCPAVSPMSCKASRFGCCWDNITTSGPAGADCPECKDQSESCQKIQDMCGIAHVQRACPISCKVRACVEGHATCFDDPQQADYCYLFKAGGFCELDPVLMKTYCKKTCNLCSYGQTEPVHESTVQDIKIESQKEKGKKDDDELLMKMVKDEIKKSDRSNELKKEAISADEDAFIKKILKDNGNKADQKPAPAVVNKDTSDDLLMELLQREVEDELKKKESEEKLMQVVKKHSSSADEIKKADEALLNLLQKDSNAALLNQLPKD